MSAIATRLAGHALTLLAWLLGVAADRADRVARRLTGAPDRIDQHLVEARRAFCDKHPLDGELDRMQEGLDQARRQVAVHRRNVGSVADVPTLSHIEVVPEQELPEIARALLRPLFHLDRITDPWIPLDQAAASMCTDLLARGLQLVRRPG